MDLVWSTRKSTPGVAESFPMNTRLSRPLFSLNLAPTPTMVLSIRSQDPLFQILFQNEVTVTVKDTVTIVVQGYGYGLGGKEHGYGYG